MIAGDVHLRRHWDRKIGNFLLQLLVPSDFDGSGRKTYKNEAKMQQKGRINQIRKKEKKEQSGWALPHPRQHAARMASTRKRTRSSIRQLGRSRRNRLLALPWRGFQDVSRGFKKGFCFWLEVEVHLQAVALDPDAGSFLLGFLWGAIPED